MSGQIPQEEDCPVSPGLLGKLYRASEHELESLITMVPVHTRAALALYCHRRSHLRSIGLAIAAGCNKDDLMDLGAYAGGVLFELARAKPHEAKPLSHFLERKNVSLFRSTGTALHPSL
jgi:hypothetical protein